MMSRRAPGAPQAIDRRAFLKLGALGAGALAFGPPRAQAEFEFPDGEQLGRVTELETRIYARPTTDSPEVGRLLYDEVVQALRRVVGRGRYAHNHVWVETPLGYIWSPDLQPVRNVPNPLLPTLPDEGLWTQLTVPYTEGRTEPDPQAAVRYRLYYDMVLNVDQRLEGADGRIWYRVHDDAGVRMWAHGESFRPIAPEEVEPIAPEAEQKTIEISLARQDLSAMQDGVEVYYARVASGYQIDRDGRTRWNTPIGPQMTWRKMISSHMSGGDRVSGWDLPGVGWTILFSGMGAAIHSTYWHNDFGTPRSRGCINVRPEDAQWLFRWSLPSVPYRPGDVIIQGPSGSRVIVRE